jgi:hypothetical protein
MQFELTERPWVVAEVSEINDFSSQQATFMVGGYVAIKNIGKSPATDLSVRVALHISGSTKTIRSIA